MQPKHLDIFELPSGRYKVMVWGTTDDHIMDWRGCNFRFTPVTGQPHRGFLALSDTSALLDKIKADPERKAFEFKRAKLVKGTFLSEYGKYQIVSVPP